MLKSSGKRGHFSFIPGLCGKASNFSPLSVCVCVCVCVCACVLSCVRLFAALWTVAFQGPLFMGFLQARILEQVAISYSRGTSRPRDQTHFSSIDKLIPYHCANWNPNSLFGNPMGCSPPGSSVHEISQARILEWVSNFSPLSVMLTIGVFDRYSFSN